MGGEGMGGKEKGWDGTGGGAGGERREGEGGRVPKSPPSKNS